MPSYLNNPLTTAEELILFKLLKNAQMQGAREPFTCRSGRQF
jgi:hypothetical protein